MAGVSILVLSLLVAAAAFSQAASGDVNDEKAYLVMPTAGAVGRGTPGDESINCLSWRLAVEANNLREWRVVPQECADYIGYYMTGKQYSADCDEVVDIAIQYAKGLNLSEDGKSIWIFDIDETALSNLPYYRQSDVSFGAKKFNRTKFYEWVELAKGPAVPAALRLYKELLELGIKIVFIDGMSELYTEARTLNLKNVGYDKYEKLILKPVAAKGVPSIVFKPKVRDELVAAGYEIVGNIGDQWSDLLGANAGQRTFKLPNPMYYAY